MITRRLLKKSASIVPENQPGLDISSLIDVSFLLLFFFVATSTLQPREADLGMSLPGIPEGGSVYPGEDFLVSLRADGMVVANDEILETDLASRTLPRLLERLKMLKQAADLSEVTPVIVLEADDAAKSQRFVDVMNCVAAADIQTVTLAGF